MENLEIKITKDGQNKLLNRREIVASAKFMGKTPTREEVKTEICKTLNLNPEASSVVKIDQTYGGMYAGIWLNSYETKEAMLKLEKEGMAKKEAKVKQVGGKAGPAKK